MKWLPCRSVSRGNNDFRIQTRGGVGIKAINLRENTGKLIGMKAVNSEDEIMLITKGGIIIRTPVKGISVLKRSATGVKIMDVMDSVAGIAKVVGEDDEDPESGEMPDESQTAEDEDDYKSEEFADGNSGEPAFGELSDRKANEPASEELSDANADDHASDEISEDNREE